MFHFFPFFLTLHKSTSSIDWPLNPWCVLSDPGTDHWQFFKPHSKAFLITTTHGSIKWNHVLIETNGYIFIYIQNCSLMTSLLEVFRHMNVATPGPIAKTSQKVESGRVGWVEWAEWMIRKSLADQRKIIKGYPMKTKLTLTNKDSETSAGEIQWLQRSI